MKKLGFIVGVLASLVATSALATSCPKDCKCDSKGNVISYNHTTNNIDNSVNATANAGANADSKASIKDSGNSVASVANSGNFNGTVKGGSSSSDSHATGISGGSFGGTAAAVGVAGNVAGGTASQEQSQSQLSENNGNNSGNANVTVEGDSTVYNARRIPVSTAYAASLTSGADTCLGSASGGVQLPVIGVSLGKTTLDRGCKLIKETHLLREFGTTPFERAACYRARAGKEGKEIDEALHAAGVNCEQIVASSDAIVTPVVAPPYVTQEDLRSHEDRIVKKVLQK